MWLLNQQKNNREWREERESEWEREREGTEGKEERVRRREVEPSKIKERASGREK